MLPEPMLQDPRFVAVLNALDCKPHQDGWHNICPSCKEALGKLLEIYEELRGAGESSSKYGTISSVEESIEHLYGHDACVTRYFREKWPLAHLEDGSKPVCPLCQSTDIRLNPKEPDRAVCIDCGGEPKELVYFRAKSVPNKNPEPVDDNVPS